MPLRVYLEDFALKNAVYAGAEVSIYTVDTATWARTETLAPLYDAPSGAGTLANPQVLDTEGKWQQAVYIDQPVVMVVTSNSIDEYETGVVSVANLWRGEWANGTGYSYGHTVKDGAAGNDTHGVYVCIEPHTSTASFTNDIAAGYWELMVDPAEIAAYVAGSLDMATYLINSIGPALSTSLPASAGILWNNGGIVCVS